MNKALKNKLKSIADKLKKDTYVVFNRVSGNERERLIKEYKGEIFDVPREKLFIKSVHAVNHLRRMKRAFVTGGEKLVNEYLGNQGSPLVFNRR